MPCHFINRWTRTYILLILTLNSFTTVYSQESQPENIEDSLKLAVQYFNLGEYSKSLEIFLKSAEYYKEKLGEKHPDYLFCLSYIGIDYSYLGNYSKALEVHLKISEIGKEVYGERNPNYLSCLNLLALDYSSLGDYKNAIDLYLKIIEIGKDVWGEKHPNYLLIQNNLANEYIHIGDYQKALLIYIKNVELQKEILGEEHQDYLTSLNNLAMVYKSLGNYRNALEIYQNVIELAKNVWGEKHPNYITILNNLSTVYEGLGDYQKELEINLKVTELRKEILGDKHPDYSSSLINLAATYKHLGNYQKALEIFLEAVELKKEILGEKHPDYLTSLNNLAVVYSDLGNYQKALEINLKVAELRKEILGDIHPDYLTSLNNLALVYSDLGNYQKALELNQEVGEMLKEGLGDKNPHYLTSLNNLAGVYSDLGDYQKAFEIDQKVTVSYKEVLGKNHPYYINSLNDLAIDEFRLSQFDSALNHKCQVTKELQHRVIEYFSLLTEIQREQFLKKNGYLFVFSTLIAEKTRLNNPESICFLYDYLLFSKGLLLNTTLDFDKLIAEKGTLEAIAKFEELKLLRLEIQRLLEKPIAERYLNVDSLENIAQQKETELVKISKEYGDYTSNLKVNWKDVQVNLQDKDVAIEFVEYPTLTDTVKYAALVLRKGWQYPKFVPLFRKDQIEGFIKQDKNKMYSNGHVGKQLRNLIWTPLETIVSPADRVYFSPAGIIHQLAIENLPLDDSTTIGDRYQMYRLSSTKELVVSHKQEPSSLAVLFGGLIYSLGIPEMEAESKKYEFEKSRNYLAMRGYQDDTNDKNGWPFLKGTKPEVDQISRLMKDRNYQVTEYTGATGNEESFKSLSGKKVRMIHIATHGYFQSVEESKKNPYILQRMGDQQQEGVTVDPMLRSGLILAGGNRAWLCEKIPQNIEDGVLMAKEISHVDLRSTDLVVLSACKTGLGEVSSEGVFGLQRSFKQAGVKTLVMSLWEVNDQATQYMMTEFYSNLLSGKDKREAFLEAKRKCKEKYIYPQYWAAFIMLD